MKELLAEQPDVALFHEQMGNVLLSKKDAPGARREFDRALQIDPNAIGALRGRLALDIRDKNVAGARATIEAAVQKAPRNTDLLLLQAGVYAAAKTLARQEQTLRRIIDIDSSHFQAFAALASLFLSSGRLEEAKTEYEALARKQPKGDRRAHDGGADSGSPEETGGSPEGLRKDRGHVAPRPRSPPTTSRGSTRRAAATSTWPCNWR